MNHTMSVILNIVILVMPLTATIYGQDTNIPKQEIVSFNLSPESSQIVLKKLIELIKKSENFDNSTESDSTEKINSRVEYQAGILYGWKSKLLYYGKEFKSEMEKKNLLVFSPKEESRDLFYRNVNTTIAVHKGEGIIHEWKQEIIEELKEFIKQRRIDVMNNKMNKSQKDEFFKVSPSLEAFLFLYEQFEKKNGE